VSAELVTWGGDPMPDGTYVTPAPPAEVPHLGERGARILTDRIRRHLESAAVDLIRAFHGRAHEALGYGEGFDGWIAYVDAEFGDLRLLKLPTSDRRELVQAMSDEGWSLGEVARATGRSKTATHYDLKGRPAADPAEGKSAGAVDEAPIVGDAEPRGELGAASTTVAVEPPAGMSKRDRAWQLIAEQGERGLTSLELAEVTGWTGGSATGTVSDLKRQRRVVALAVFRRGYAAHVIVEPETP
jgi:hypothetical protein